MEVDRARTLALGRISRRETSSRELARWLVGRGATVEQAEGIVADLVERGYVDDRRYSAILVRELIRQGKGPRMIQQKLVQKGLRMSDGDVDALIAAGSAVLFGGTEGASGPSDLDRAREIVDRRYPEHGEDRAEAQRAYQALIRRGFSFDVARRALKK